MLQSIIDYSNGLEINRRKVVGISTTRNEILRTTETPTRNTWKFTVNTPASLAYSDARALIEAIDNLDRSVPSVITFSNNPNLSWMFAYQGTANTTQLNGLTVVSFTGTQLTLRTSQPISNTTTVFKANDIITIGTALAYPYPFTIVNDYTPTTSLVANDTFTVTTHRGNFISSSIAGLGLTVGNQVRFNMLCINMPTYKLSPGGQRVNNAGQLINNALLEWSDPFELVEYTGTI